MEFCPDFERIKERYRQYWARENHDLALISVKAPRTNREAETPVSRHATLRERWMDTAYTIEKWNADVRNTFYGGEALPVFNPNLGPDIFAACYGAELEFGEDTSWARHFLEDGDDRDFSFNAESVYYQKILEITRAAVEDGAGRYLVGITDLHPGLDALSAMRGPAELCVDTLERPEWIVRSAVGLFEGFRRMVDELHGIISARQEGSINWMEVWHPGKWYVTSCDFSCMISPEAFEELLVEELLMELDFLDASIFHLDGPGALRHLDRLLRVDTLNGIQWVYGASQPTASHWMDVLRKIQAAGKCSHIDVEPEELEILLKELPPEGMLYNIRAKSEEQARALLKMAERHRRGGSAL